jgi:hypothetical protein|tara:strand:+ start:499 stop:621 length:123 start_codon:yes stop_codon:yes gene_type:complete
MDDDKITESQEQTEPQAADSTERKCESRDDSNENFVLGHN